jgi:16S rRNA (uracil1498-N3)-methyltransferase
MIKMRVPRFYLNPIQSSEELIIDDAQRVHHISKVLRMNAGSKIELFDGLGVGVQATITTVKRNKIECQVNSIEKHSKEMGRCISAIVPVIKKDAFAFMVQKLTEIGVANILIYRAELEDQSVTKKKNFSWLDYAIEIACLACEQSGNNFLPICTLTSSLPKALTDFHKQFDKAGLVCLDTNNNLPIYEIIEQLNNNVAVISGPESGLSDNELAILKKSGALSCSLGKNILRAETAPIVAAFSLMR